MMMRVHDIDRSMMLHCIGLSKTSGKSGEYPYAAVICRDGVIVAEALNRVTRDRDVTRHAEAVAISQAQKTLGTSNLDGCEIYMNAEPCALCSYAIRETRIRRVIFGLKSPHMGGLSKWNILGDPDLETAMPEVFAPVPEIVSGYMAKEAEQALIEWNPLVTGIIKQRGLFGTAPRVIIQPVHPFGIRNTVFRFLRQHVFDYFGRRSRVGLRSK
jgi:tRNA(adenine34) deaminase